MSLMRSPSCGGCGSSIRPECEGSWARVGVVTVHWECWSECNLNCPFCYRTVSQPLDTRAAERLLAHIAASGVENIVFGGGDPSLRPDLIQLFETALTLGLKCELRQMAKRG